MLFKDRVDAGNKLAILAVPVAPIDFDNSQFDASYILHKDKDLSAISQFYAHFPQVSDEEIKKILCYHKYYGTACNSKTDYFF